MKQYQHHMLLTQTRVRGQRTARLWGMYMRASDWPLEHHFLLVTPPGTFLVVVKGRFGGLGMGTEDGSDVTVVHGTRRAEINRA